ncbi:MAG: hypothetical protein ABWY93_32645 [Mycobacterium sp.]
MASVNFKVLPVHGFWLHHWLTSPTDEQIDRVYTELFELIADGVLHTPVAAAYPPGDHVEAMNRARAFGHSGKVLFTAAGHGATR